MKTRFGFTSVIKSANRLTSAKLSQFPDTFSRVNSIFNDPVSVQTAFVNRVLPDLLGPTINNDFMNSICFDARSSVAIKPITNNSLIIYTQTLWSLENSY